MIQPEPVDTKPSADRTYFESNQVAMMDTDSVEVTDECS